MEIIKPGNLPGEKEYQITCFNCGCVFKFKKKEAKETHCQRDGSFLSINCPQAGCGARNTIDL